ncbi:MAG: hypothetical protein APF76_12790 [Desulfitibacter sp. BRH_c19]|nr:MAG: hypothetical protein APF76_12790 [Desulfitibacter sp. BRH_c19]
MALSLPRKSLKNPSHFSASTSMISVPGHKEEDLSISLARSISKGTARTCALVIVIHFDDITEQ